MMQNELYYILVDVYAHALALCSGVDLVALKTLELLGASIALCLHSYIRPGGVLHTGLALLESFS